MYVHSFRLTIPEVFYINTIRHIVTNISSKAEISSWRCFVGWPCVMKHFKWCLRSGRPNNVTRGQNAWVTAVISACLLVHALNGSTTRAHHGVLTQNFKILVCHTLTLFFFYIWNSLNISPKQNLYRMFHLRTFSM